MEESSLIRSVDGVLMVQIIPASSVCEVLKTNPEERVTLQTLGLPMMWQTATRYIITFHEKGIWNSPII